MPQWRKLHVKATESLDINDMPNDFHRLLWLMLPLGLDRVGCGLDNPAWIKAKIMPLRMDVTYEMIEAAMQWYTSRGMILRYQVEGRAYFCVKSFQSYQGNTEREATSNYPPPPAELLTNSRPTQDPLATNSSLDADVDSDVDAEDGAKPAPKHRKSTKDTRTAHPAIQAIFKITGRYPQKDQYDVLISALGDFPDEDKLLRCWQEWRCERSDKKPFSPVNYGWVVDWYRHGIPKPGAQSNGYTAA